VAARNTEPSPARLASSPSAALPNPSAYRRLFPAMQIFRSLEFEVSTTARGFRISTSVYGTLTGLGGDVFIIDDPQKPVDAQSDTQRNRLNHWVSNTLMSRLDSKENGIIIVVQQRVHLNDLSGYLMELGGWEVLSLAAIAEQDETIAIGDDEFHVRRAGEALHPELESLESLERLRREIGSDVFAAAMFAWSTVLPTAISTAFRAWPPNWSVSIQTSLSPFRCRPIWR
jgi:hypothetical protein